jgi:hypothetical protein
MTLFPRFSGNPKVIDSSRCCVVGRDWAVSTSAVQNRTARQQSMTRSSDVDAETTSTRQFEMILVNFPHD